MLQCHEEVTLERGQAAPRFDPGGVGPWSFIAVHLLFLSFFPLYV